MKIRLIDFIRLGRTVQLVWHSSPYWTVATTCLLFLQGMIPLLSLYLIKLLINAVATSQSSPNKEGALSSVMFLVIASGGVTIASTLCRSMASSVAEIQAQKTTDHVHSVLHTKSIEIDLEYYENPQYYDTFHRAQQEAKSRPTHALNSLIQIGQNTISLLAIAGLILTLHWWIALVLFISAVPGLFLRLKYAAELHSWERQRTCTERLSRYFDWILTSDVHAKEIRTFDLGLTFIQKFRDLRKMLFRERMKISVRRSLTDLVAQICASFAVYGVFAFVAYQTVTGSITLGDMVMYYQSFQRGQEFLQQILLGLSGLYQDNLFLDSLYDFLDLKQKVTDPVVPRPIPQPMNSGIKFHHVTFQYPGDNRIAIKDVSLSVRPGETVAIVGHNGSGKTTLVKLLCRLYDPVSGSITIDGIDLREFKISSLRSQISVTFQDYARYFLTARENIAVGTKEPIDDTLIINAARCANAAGIIDSLPQGYDTPLGKWFNDGVELSVGQWQRIALARAFLRAAQIVVLDEPTSALDAQSEYEVTQKFRQLSEGRTTFLISHRLSTVKFADCIYVLEDGVITESGTHEDLFQKHGTYARLFETQAQNYR